MRSFRRKVLVLLLRVSDLCILGASLTFAPWMISRKASHFTLADFLAARVSLLNVLTLVALFGAWFLLFDHYQLYRSRRLAGNTVNWKDILKATTLGTSVIAMGGVVLSIGFVTPAFLGIFWLTSTSLTLAFRSALRLFLRKIRRSGRNLRNILIAGTNERAYRFARTIEGEKGLGYRLLGFIDDEIHTPDESVTLLGAVSDFPAIVRDRVVDEVFIALPIKSFYDQIRSIVAKAEEHGIIIRYLSEFFDPQIGQSTVDRFEHFTVLTITSGPQDGWELFAKQCLDKVFALLLLVITSPLLLSAAIAIKLTSPGPVFFIQSRVGLNKRIFRLYKFRTMDESAALHQAELESQNEVSGPVFKIKNDPRITRVGRWLRKWSIDELPQLINVIVGDMSLVGPRPLPLRDFEKFGEDWNRRRFSVRPGITCTWQIEGRNALTFDEWIKLDMEYIDGWRLSKDLKILAGTIPAVLRGSGM